MNRRDAAQVCVGQIQRFTRGVEHGNEWNALAVAIRYNADSIAQIQRAGLLRDVAGRKILAKEAFQIAPLGLADHLARSIVREAIDHHAVIAEHRLDQPGGIPDQAIDIVDILEPAQHGAGKRERLLVFVGDFFKLDNDRRFKAVNGNVNDPVRIKSEPKYQGRPRRVVGSRQRIAHAVSGIRPQQVFKRPAIDFAFDPEHGLQVVRMAQDGRCADVGGDQAAMTLDAPRNMDRLPVTISQVGI